MSLGNLLVDDVNRFATRLGVDVARMSSPITTSKPYVWRGAVLKLSKLQKDLSDDGIVSPGFKGFLKTLLMLNLTYSDDRFNYQFYRGLSPGDSELTYYLAVRGKRW